MKLKEFFKLQRGSQRAFAKVLGVSESMVSQMAAGTRQVPRKKWAFVEKYTNGLVTKVDMYPDWLK